MKHTIALAFLAPVLATAMTVAEYAQDVKVPSKTYDARIQLYTVTERFLNSATQKKDVCITDKERNPRYLYPALEQFLIESKDLYPHELHHVVAATFLVAYPCKKI